MARFVRWLFVQVVSYCAVFLFAQNHASAQRPESPSHTPKSDTGTNSDDHASATFKARANLVLVRVVVRDSAGHAVGNLMRDDFQLFDRGKPQVISKFDMEQSSSRTVEEKDGEQRSNEPAIRPSPVSPNKDVPIAMAERFIAYLFDDVHLSFEDLARTRDAADRQLSALSPADRVAIFTTSSQTALDFTGDRTKLHETLVRLQPRSMTRPEEAECPQVTYFMADLILNKHDREALLGAAAEAAQCLHIGDSRGDNQNIVTIPEQAAMNTAARVLAAGDSETRFSFGALQNALRRISTAPGQRSLVLISPGFLMLSAYRQHDETALIDRAIRSGVVISALDARGLYVIIPGGEASEDTDTTAATENKARYQSTAALVQNSVLAELAQGTGGTFVHNTNDFDNGLKQVVAAPEYVYVLGFEPRDLKQAGRFHNLKITLRKAHGLTLQARRGYYEPNQGEGSGEWSKQDMQDLLFSREELQDIPIDLHAQLAKAGDGVVRASFLIHVDLRQILLSKKGNQNQNALRIFLVLFDPNGKYITGQERRVGLRPRTETAARSERRDITVKMDYDLKPGGYLVRVVVRDAEGEMSAANSALEVSLVGKGDAQPGPPQSPLIPHQ